VIANFLMRRSRRHHLDMRPGSSWLTSGTGFSLILLLAMLAVSTSAWSAPRTDKGLGQKPPPLPGAEEQGNRNGPEAITIGNWTNLYPDLNTVSAGSSTDAWAGGEYGRLLHYTGGSWVEVDPIDMRGEFIKDIDMVSPSSGWLVTGYRAFQYNGSVWQEKSQGLGSDGLYVNYVSAVSADDVWGLGYVFNPHTNCCGRISHWDGSSWTAAGPAIPFTTHFTDIEMINATDGWTVGFDYPGGGEPTTPVLYHYNAGTWSSVAMPTDVGRLIDVAIASPTDIWFIGYDTVGTHKLYRYSGGTWSSFAIVQGFVPISLFMLDSSQGWVVTPYSIMHWDGTSWSVEYNITDTAIYDISGAAGKVWAVGMADTILGRPGSGPWVQERGGPTTNALYSVYTLSTDDAWAVGDGGVIAHYTGGTWQPVASPSTDALFDVQMLSPTDGYAVGVEAILKWDGTSWLRVATPPAPLRGVYMLGSGEGWAVGEDGAIWNASGGTWSSVASPTMGDLSAIAMDSSSHGWAVGSATVPEGVVPVLLEYTGGNWVDRSSTLPPNSPLLRDIVLAPDGATGWAVGMGWNGGGVLRLSGGVWMEDHGDSMYSISLEALGEAWGLGNGVRIYHRVGGEWRFEGFPPAGSELYDISLIPGRGGWVVGGRGTILRYDPLGPGQRYYDVPTTNTFYSFIECMTIENVISGYDDNTFRPNNSVTRGQLAKIVSNAAGFDADPGSQVFEDVPPDSTFYTWINRLSNLGIMGGYACGGEGEPCGSDNKPYFRTNNNATRGQISKIVSNAAGYNEPAGTQIFEDVSPDSAFYEWVQRLATRGIMGGYNCGGEGEPCGSDNKPYFRPNNNATRGQTSKIVANTFFPACAVATGN
jgi:photosystem II stability/assembly factor-like uncharacterized protein